MRIAREHFGHLIPSDVLQMTIAGLVYYGSAARVTNDYSHLTKGLNGDQHKALLELVKLVADNSDDFTDVLGVIYEELLAQSKASWMGQFFTPQSLSRMIAKMNMEGADENKPGGLRIADPSGCGSGRMLLAAAEALQATRNNHLFVGVDMDYWCCLMTISNCWMHSLPTVVLHGNGLFPEVFHAWQVSLQPMAYGPPLPIISELDAEQAKNWYWGMFEQAQQQQPVAEKPVVSKMETVQPQLPPPSKGNQLMLF